jgi:hypothetical protein
MTHRLCAAPTITQTTIVKSNTSSYGAEIFVKSLTKSGKIHSQDGVDHSSLDFHGKLFT